MLETNEIAEGYLCGTTFTGKWLIEKLNEKCEEFRKVAEKTDVKQVTDECISQGVGFISKVILCTIDFTNPDIDPFKIILKVPGLEALNTAIEKSEIGKDNNNQKSTAVHKNLELMHKRECEFYEKFSDIPGLPLVKIYDSQALILGQQQGYILMEYVGDDGVLVDFSKGLNLEQIKTITKHIAHFHAYAIIHENLWRGNYPPIDLTEGIEEDASRKLVEGMSRMFPSLKERLSKVHKIFSREFFKWQAEHCETLGLYKGLCHGDLWTNNILFHKKSDDSSSDRIRAIIDWQVVNEGNLMQDLARFLVSCSDSHVRREAEIFIFDDYYIIVKEELEKVGRSVPFDLDEIYKAYDAAFLFQACFAFWMITFAFPQPLSDEGKDKQAHYLKRVEDVLDDVHRILSKRFSEFL